jgi:hypothetical protein
VAYLAWAQAIAGHVDDARRGLAELEARAGSEYVSPFHRAAVHAALGDLDRGFAGLHDSIEAGVCWMGAPRLPLFDAFRGDPRFTAMLRTLGHPDWEQKPLREQA